MSEVINGYRLQNLMGSGQMSQVWEVVELTSHRHFAMKMLLQEKVNSAPHRRSLFHEASVGIKLAHPNVIKIITISRDRVNPHSVMEFFPAGSLKVRVLGKQKDFIMERGLDILKQAATGLAYMNASGWVHRDVKLDNILCNNAGEVRLIDFALSQRIPTGMARLFYFRGAKAQGTRSYMSPEQIRGKPLDGRADIYSFGASCYELVTGRPPFRGNTGNDLLNKHMVEKPVTPQIYNPEITDDFAALVLRMLAKKKEERPQSFHDVLMALRTMKVFKSAPVKKTAD